MSQQDLDTSPLSMSDDEFANLDPSDYPAEEAEAEEDTVTDDTDSDGSETAAEDADDATGDEQDQDDDSTESDESDTGETDDGDITEKDGDDADDADEDTDTDGDDAETGPDKDKDDSEDKDTDKDADADNEEKSEVDYKAEYEKLMAPFRANGKDMSVQNVDEVRQLMQMGANYNKKMSALKPSLKTLKLLENNDLMGEEKLSYLIDLHKGNPEAIKKLVKESGIDPLDMDVESDSDYKPNTYTVDDRELALDEVLDKIQDTPTYSETVNVVSNKWDKDSKQAVADNPQLLETINDHMASGIYERVRSAVEKERTFGRLNGMSDLEAYQQVGDALNAKGGFDDLFADTQEDRAPAKKTVVPPKAKANTDTPALKSKKRAASSTKAKTAAPAPDYNPLGMSDEEFDKQFNTNLM